MPVHYQGMTGKHCGCDILDLQHQFCYCCTVPAPLLLLL